jgi:hypothetical protein
MHVSRRRGYPGGENADEETLERCSAELESRDGCVSRPPASSYASPPPKHTHLPLSLLRAYLPNRNLNRNLIAPRCLGPRLAPRAHEINLQHVPAHAHTVRRNGAPEDERHEVIAERALLEV